jgi:hypothetical protein
MNMTVKEQLYYLIEHYMLGDYDTQTYSDQFADIFFLSDVDTKESQLTEEEYGLFREVADIAKRVSCYQEDMMKHPGVYFTECDIRRKTIEVCKKLNIKY